MNNIAKIIGYLKKYALLTDIKELARATIVRQDRIAFDVIVATEEHIKDGDHPNTFLLSYNLTPHEQSITFAFYENMQEKPVFEMKEIINEEQPSINLAMEAILGKIFSENGAPYDVVFKVVDDVNINLYNRLKKTQKHDEIIETFMESVQQINDTAKNCQVVPDNREEKALIAYLESAIPLEHESYIKIQTKKWNANAYHFLIEVHNDHYHNETPIIELGINCYRTDNPMVTTNIRYADSGWKVNSTGFDKMKCLNGASNFIMAFMEKLEDDNICDRLVKIADIGQ